MNHNLNTPTAIITMALAAVLSLTSATVTAQTVAQCHTAKRACDQKAKDAFSRCMGGVNVKVERNGKIVVETSDLAVKDCEADDAKRRSLCLANHIDCVEAAPDYES